MLFPPAPCHVVHFYKDPNELSHIVSRFLADGLAIGQPAVVVARAQLCRRIEVSLESLGIDVRLSKADGRLVVLIADTILPELLIGGRPDPVLFRRAVDSLCKQMHEMRVVDSDWHRMHQMRADGVVRVYGEMVDVLWQAGERVAALELEELWNTLPSSYRFLVLCSYSTDGRHEHSTTDDLCTFHSHVMSGSGELAAMT